MVRDGCCAILIYIDLVSQFGFTELICHQYLQCASPIISKDGSEDCVRAYFRVYFSVYFPNFPTKYSCCLQKLISQLIFEPHEPIVALRIVHAESSWYFILYLSVQEYFTGFTYHWFSWQWNIYQPLASCYLTYFDDYSKAEIDFQVFNFTLQSLSVLQLTKEVF